MDWGHYVWLIFIFGNGDIWLFSVSMFTCVYGGVCMYMHAFYMCGDTYVYMCACPREQALGGRGLMLGIILNRSSILFIKAASLSQVQGSQYGYCHQPSCSRDPLTLPPEARITGVPPILLLCGFWVWRWLNSLTTEFFPSHFKVTTEYMGVGRTIKSRDSIWQTATYV